MWRRKKTKYPPGFEKKAFTPRFRNFNSERCAIAWLNFVYNELLLYSKCKAIPFGSVATQPQYIPCIHCSRKPRTWKKLLPIFILRCLLIGRTIPHEKYRFFFDMSFLMNVINKPTPNLAWRKVYFLSTDWCKECWGSFLNESPFLWSP